MIKTQLLTPEVYYKESRDFQLFGRLYDVLYNYLKTNIDLMQPQEFYDTTETNFIELQLNTLGFFPKRNYSLQELKFLCSVYSEIIRNKGSIKGIEILIKSVLRSIGETNKFSIDMDNTAAAPTIRIRIQNYLSSQQNALIEEVLDYIMPIGVDYYIQNVTLLDEYENLSIKLSENVGLAKAASNDLSRVAKNEIIEETSLIENNNVYTGTFSSSKTDNLTVGSIKVGLVTREHHAKENLDGGNTSGEGE